MNLQQRAEQVLNQLNNQVQTLPSADAIPAPGFITLESTWDLKKAGNRAQHQQQKAEMAIMPRYSYLFDWLNVCLFVLGFDIPLTVFQSYRDSTHMRQVCLFLIYVRFCQLWDNWISK